MTTLLIILAHPHTDDFSWSLATVEEFKKSYQESHPLDKIIIRDLFSEKVPALDNETFAACQHENELNSNYLWYFSL